MFMVQKLPFFQLFCFREYKPGKCLLRYSRTKKRHSRLEKQEFQKVEKLTKKNIDPSFWFKNGHFSNLYFLGNIIQENVFYDILEQKNPFLSYKNKKF